MSASDFQDYDFKPVPQQPRSRGCLFYGCVFAGVGAILLAALLGVVGYMGWSWYTGLIAQYTEDKPRPLPAVTLDPEAQDALAKRAKEYREAIDDGKPLTDRTFVLNSDELNALVNQEEDLKGKVAFTIEGDKLKGQISFPLGETELPRTAGRYLNGEATFKVDLDDDRLIVTADEVTVKGEPLPDSFMKSFWNKNLAEDWEKGEGIAKTLRRLERVEVKDGKLIITAKAPDAPAAGAPAPTPEATPAPTPEAAPKSEPGTPKSEPASPKIEPETPKAQPDTAKPAAETAPPPAP
jgi:hypothetical protein